MGRWAQRSRGGGGLNPPNYMTLAVNTDSDEHTVTYAHAIAAESLQPGAFQSNPSGESGADVNQLDATRVIITFGGSVTGDTDLTFNGSTANVITPQTVDVT